MQCHALVFSMSSGWGYCTDPTCFPTVGARPILVFLCKTHCQHMLCHKHWLFHRKNLSSNNEKSPSVSADNVIKLQENGSVTKKKRIYIGETIVLNLNLELDSDDESNDDRMPTCFDLLKEYISPEFAQTDGHNSSIFSTNNLIHNDHDYAGPSCTKVMSSSSSADQISRKEEQSSCIPASTECSEKNEILEQQKQPIKKEIEWWNEITQWKNNQSYIVAVPSDADKSDIEIIVKSDDSMDSDYTTGKKRTVPKTRTERSSTGRYYIGQCPLTFDGAFGLTQSAHELRLCPQLTKNTKKICLYRHFHVYHGFTRATSMRLVQASMDRQDPHVTNLFSRTRDKSWNLIDPLHKVTCPLSEQANEIVNTPCMSQRICRKSLRRHLERVHRLNREAIDRIVREMIQQ